MNNELSLVTDWLLCASSQVTAPYFQLPVAGQEELTYRERVYCYELYHCWRKHWSDGFPFSLSGEIDKSGHALIRRPSKPDFLVHVPGQMRNLPIVEVKPANAQRREMAEDLEKLTYFRRDLKDLGGSPRNHDAAYFWLYGLPIAEWPKLRREVLDLLGNSKNFDRDLIS